MEYSIFKPLFLFTITLMISVGSWAASPAPGSLMTYEGVLTDSGGNPISTSTVTTFKILYGACTLFQESQTITPGTQGEFSVILGTGTRMDSTGNTAENIFTSNGTVTCAEGGTATISTFSVRILRITIAGLDLTPDVTIGNIPVAINTMNSMKLANREVSEFLLKSGLPTCTAGTYLTYDGSNLTCSTPSGGTTGITSLNGQAGATQTFAIGTSSLLPLWTSNSNTHTLNIPMAATGGVAAGLISKAEYDSFSAKQPSGNYITGLTGDVVASGPGSASAIIANNSVTSLKIADGSISATDMDFTGTNTAASSLVIRDSSGKFTNFACSTIGQIPTWNAAGWSCQNIGSIAFVNGGNSFGTVAALGTNDTNSLTLKAGGNPQMTILPTGKIGIGTTTPAYPLEITGGTAGDYTKSTISTDGNIRLGDFDYTGAAGKGLILAKVFDGTSGHKGYFYLNTPSGNGAAVTLRTADQTMSASIQLTNSDGRLSFQTGGTERLSIANNGTVTASAAIINTPAVVSAGNVDLSKSNVHTLNSIGGSVITLTNMVSGGRYTLLVTDTNSRTYTFSGCATSKFSPTNGSTFAGTVSNYDILTIYNGSTYDCYIKWATGFQ